MLRYDAAHVHGIGTIISLSGVEQRWRVCKKPLCDSFEW